MERDEGHWPLVGFTALAPIAVGGLAGLLTVRGTLARGVDGGASILLGVTLVALLSSLLHLGHPFRAYRAIARLSTSWLSREVVIFTAFVLLLTMYTLGLCTGDGGAGRTVIGIVTVATGAVGLWATGRVYRLPSRPAWDHGRTIASLFLGALGAGLLTGVAAGTVGQAGLGAIPAGVVAVAVVALLASALLTFLRGRRPDPARAEEFAAWEMAVGPCRWILRLRIVATLCALAFLLAPGWLWLAAWLPATVGEVADRTLFFRAVVAISLERRAGVAPFEPVSAPPRVLRSSGT